MKIFISNCTSIGNAGNPISRLPKFQKLLKSKNASDDLKVLAFAPSSYWLSSNRKICEKNLLDDYNQALQYTMKIYPSSPIYLYGHSLGGSIGCLISHRFQHHSNIRGLILENSFKSLPEMVKSYFHNPRIPYYHLHPFTFDKFNAVNDCHKIKLPTLVMISENDELVPHNHGEAIFKNLGTDNKQLKVIKNSLHENAYLNPSWSKIFNDFININVKNHYN